MNIPLPRIISRTPRPFPHPAKETYAYFLANSSHTRAVTEALGMAAPPPPPTPKPPSHKRRAPRNALLELLSSSTPPPAPDLPPPPA